MTDRLSRDFFLRSTDDVAKDLLGKMMVINHPKLKKTFHAIITETESYHGDDPASHASRKRTPRNEPMFWQGGHLYVYLIYGMYHCLNITTDSHDYPAAVLIRGVKLLEVEGAILNGPGKLCRHMAIDKSFDQLDFCAKENQEVFSIYDTGLRPEYKATPRIGISQNKEALLRFVVTPN